MTRPLPRLRQAVLAAAELEPVVAAVRGYLGAFVPVPEPYQDPGVDRFGLRNAVLSVGDSFLEVVCPVRDGTAVGRQLARRGGDGGYMAMVEVADIDAARPRLAAEGVRVVWEVALPDVTDLHLHPRDLPGTLAALDAVDPRGSWRWGGPAHTGVAADVPPGGLAGLTLAVPDPAEAARRWAAVLGPGASPTLDPPVVVLAGGAQQVGFVPAADAGLTAITFRLPGVQPGHPPLRIGDTDIRARPLTPAGSTGVE
jgi:Glyoxalase-like domain